MAIAPTAATLVSSPARPDCGWCPSHPTCVDCPAASVGKDLTSRFLTLLCTILLLYGLNYRRVLRLSAGSGAADAKTLPAAGSRLLFCRRKSDPHAKSPYKESSCTSLCSGPCISRCLDTYRSPPLNKEACQRGASVNREIIQTVRHRLIKTSSPFTALVLH